MADTEARVKEIIVEQLGVDPTEVVTGASFVNDLGADSLDTVELVMTLGVWLSLCTASNLDGICHYVAGGIDVCGSHRFAASSRVYWPVVICGGLGLFAKDCIGKSSGIRCWKPGECICPGTNKSTNKGKMLWLRLIGSTVFGAGLDTVLFCVVAFAGELSLDGMLNYILVGIALKIVVEIVLLPINLQSNFAVEETRGGGCG